MINLVSDKTDTTILDHSIKKIFMSESVVTLIRTNTTFDLSSSKKESDESRYYT